MERIKLSYSSPLRRVKVAVLPVHSRKGDDFAKKMIQRAKAKCEAEKKAGRIAIFQVYDQDFYKLWQELRTSKQIPASHWTNFTLAQGGYPLTGLQIRLDSNKQQFILDADIGASEQTLLSWPNFLLNVRLSLAEQNAPFPVHEGMLRSIYLQLKSGAKIKDLKVKLQSEDQNELKNPGFLVNTERGEAYLLLSRPDIFADREQISKLISRVEAAFQKVQTKFPNAVFHLEDVQRNLQMFAKGPERLGIGLPKTILFAGASQTILQPAVKEVNASTQPIKASGVSSSSQTLSKSQGAKEKKKNQGNWLFKFDIDELGVEARIIKVNEFKLFEKPDGAFTRDRLVKELQQAGIKACYEPFVEKILNLIALESNLVGQVVAKGELAAAGEEPYLHMVYMEKDEKRLEEMIEDVRSAQNRKIIEAGKIIAEVRYRDGNPGRNIFGEVTNILAHEDLLGLVIGEGVRKSRDGQFVATINGMPLFDGKKLSCSPVYIHKGDVNLSSGNINFDGSAEIHGNIESGATVLVTGHLVVKGTIGRALVRCGGDLNVRGGILGGSAAWVESGGNMYAEFIENAKVAVSGNLEVKTSIMNSSVIVGDSLKMRDLKGGTIGGGYISVRNTMHTGNLGFEDGKKTICRIGSDWLMERRIAIQEGRKESLEKAHDVERRNIEELQSKKMRTVEIAKQIEQRTKKVNRIGLLIRKLDRKIAGFSKLVSWNRDGMAKVEELIVKNIDLVVGGKPIIIHEDMKAVMITFHKYRENRVNPLESLGAYMKSKGGGSEAA